MFTGIIISSLLMVVIFIIWKIMKSGLKGPPLSAYEQPLLFLAKGDITPSNTNAVNVSEDDWWKRLDNKDQLHLALMLILKGLPVWEKYASSLDITYINSSTKPVSKINSQLLQIAIADITFNTTLQHLRHDENKINRCYYQFVEPVIAIQDGNWVPPYPVKKIFLAVYYVLKSIVEQNNLSGSKNFLATSMQHSLDGIEMSKLYSKEEITVFLETYKIKL